MSVRRAVLISLVTLLTPVSCFGAPLNPNFDFSSGLSDWDATGDVADDAGVAVLSDASGGGTLLQSTQTGPGAFTLSFDLFSAVAAAGTQGTPGNVFPDLGAGTLYFSNSALTVATLAGEAYTPLFDADSNGVVSGLSNVALGNGWFRYTLEFSTALSFLTPVFDLFDQDFVTNSALKIDNVTIEAAVAPVPEPMSMLLLGAALPFLRGRRGKLR